ncbi:MAG: hypothetical protein Q9200_007561, partial [Gallowayella weberi]
NEKVPSPSTTSHHSKNRTIVALSYGQLIQQARQQYVNTVPPFTFEGRWLKDGHLYEVVLASPSGQHPHLAALMTRKVLLAVGWNTKLCFWTLEAGCERWIVALVNPIFTEPDNNIRIPYNRWLGVGQGVDGFSDHPVAFLAPTNMNNRSYLENSNRATKQVRQQRRIRHSLGQLFDIESPNPVIRTSFFHNLWPALDTSPEPASRKRRCDHNHTLEDAIGKKHKALDALSRTVEEILRQDGAWYRNLSIKKPPFVTRKDTLATAKKAPQFTAFLADAEGQCTQQQVQVYGHDYSPAFLYWVTNIAGGERIVIKSVDTQGGIFLRLWLGHDYGKDHTFLSSDSEPETFVSAQGSAIQERTPSGGARALVQNRQEQTALPNIPRSSNPDKSAFILPLTPTTTTGSTGSDHFHPVSEDETNSAQEDILGPRGASSRAATADRPTHWQHLREKLTHEGIFKQSCAIDPPDNRNADDEIPADTQQTDVTEVGAVGKIGSQVAATTTNSPASTSPLPAQTDLQPPASHQSPPGKRGETAATTTEHPEIETDDSNPVESAQQHSLTLHAPTPSSTDPNIQAPAPTPRPHHTQAKKGEMEELADIEEDEKQLEQLGFVGSKHLR